MTEEAGEDWQSPATVLLHWEWRKSILNTHWKDWCWSSNTLVTWCNQLTHWKKPWSWKRLKAEEEEGDRGQDGWMVSLMQWTWTWTNSRRWWGTGRPGVLQSMGSRRLTWLGDWATMRGCWLVCPVLVTEGSPELLTPKQGRRRLHPSEDLSCHLDQSYLMWHHKEQPGQRWICQKLLWCFLRGWGGYCQNVLFFHLFLLVGG